MTVEEKMLVFDTNLLIAMFKVTVEQSHYVTGKYKQQNKKDFQMWQKLGFKMLESFEKSNLVHYEEIEHIAGQMQDILSKSREESLLELKK